MRGSRPSLKIGLLTPNTNQMKNIEATHKPFHLSVSRPPDFLAAVWIDTQHKFNASRVLTAPSSIRFLHLNKMYFRFVKQLMLIVSCLWFLVVLSKGNAWKISNQNFFLSFYCRYIYFKVLYFSRFLLEILCYFKRYFTPSAGSSLIFVFRNDKERNKEKRRFSLPASFKLSNSPAIEDPYWLNIPDPDSRQHIS